MPKRRDKKGVAPYTKYHKRPFVYLHPGCNHTLSVKQSVKTPQGSWSGRICTRCNIITGVIDAPIQR